MSDVRQELKVYIPDATYGRDDWEEQSPKLKKRLSDEYQLPFDETDIGTGAGEPAFVTALIDTWPIVVATGIFFSGKRVKENLDAWIAVFQTLKAFFNEDATFDRNGVAVLAINGIKTALGKLPDSVRLAAYETDTLLNQPLEELQRDANEISGIAPALGQVRRATIHRLQIEADENLFQVLIQGSTVIVLKKK
jgi:hypothetical protein